AHVEKQHGMPEGWLGKLTVPEGPMAELVEQAAQEPTPAQIPQPVTTSQTGVYKIATAQSLTNAEKIAQIEAKLGDFGHPPNIEYAEQVLAHLKAQEGHAQTQAIKPEEVDEYQEPSIWEQKPASKTQEEMHEVATHEIMSPQNKLTQLHADIENASD